MKMSKATQKDMEAALELCRALENLSGGYLPDVMAEGQEDAVHYEEREHAEKVVEYIIGIQRRASLFRVCFGMTVLLDPENEIVDQELTYLELHPRLRACYTACEGIPDELLQSWLNPPEGQLGAPHGTWAQQLTAAGNQLVEMQKRVDLLKAALEKINNVALGHPYAGCTCGEIARAAIKEEEVQP